MHCYGCNYRAALIDSASQILPDRANSGKPMSKNTLLGIPNCDTVKKARRWLDQQGVDYQFHDFRKDGCDASLVAGWIKAGAKTSLVNKRSTTWKSLDEKNKQLIEDALGALPSNAELSQLNKKQIDAICNILSQSPTLIKRPVLEHGSTLTIGFSETEYSNIF